MEELRAKAVASHRSLSGEILFRLRRSMETEEPRHLVMLRDEAAIQADAWESLAGKWRSDLSVAEEIESLYAMRSDSRETDASW